MSPSPDSRRVLQVIPALTEGGAQRSAVEMALYLKRVGWHPHVATADGPMRHELEQAGVPVHILPLQRKTPWIIAWNSWRLGRIIDREGIGLVHARSRAPAWSAWLACRSRFSRGVKYITTYHGTYGTGGLGKKWYNSVMLRGPWVIANSMFIRDHLVREYGYPVKHIVVAPRGVEPAVFDPDRIAAGAVREVRKVCGVPGGLSWREGGVPLLLMVGRLTPWKGHELLFRALGLLTDLPWQLGLAGGIDPADKHYTFLRELAAELGIADRIHFLGSRSDVPTLNAAADIALSCSVRPEAFGRVAVEAMAMGTPVVATALGGSLETIRDGVTGFLVQPDATTTREPVFAPHSLAKTLRNALTKREETISMGHQARNHALAEYTVEACCRKEMQAYLHLLGSADNNN